MSREGEAMDSAIVALENGKFSADRSQSRTVQFALPVARTVGESPHMRLSWGDAGERGGHLE